MDVFASHFQFRIKAIEEATGHEHITPPESYLNVTANQIENLLDTIESADSAATSEIADGFHVTGAGTFNEPWRILFPSVENRNFQELELELPDVSYSRRFIGPREHQLYFTDPAETNGLETQFKLKELTVMLTPSK